MRSLILFVFLSLFFISLLSVFTAAHSFILYDIDLDFDPASKERVTHAAQEYLGIDEEPLRFDYDRELIIAQFDRGQELSAAVHPGDFSIMGFRNDSLAIGGTGRDAKLTLTAKERKAIAQKVFDRLPQEKTAELVYGEERKMYSGTFEHTWYRKIDGAYVMNDHLEVEVDPASGEVAAWRFSLFSYPREDITTAPAVSSAVAQKIAEINSNAKPAGFTPVFVIEGNRPVWITKVKSLYSFFVEVDALDGSIIREGTLTAELPEGYSYGNNLETVDNELIKSIYGG